MVFGAKFTYSYLCFTMDFSPEFTKHCQGVELIIVRIKIVLHDSTIIERLGMFTGIVKIRFKTTLTFYFILPSQANQFLHPITTDQGWALANQLNASRYVESSAGHDFLVL